jgi:hypothetical protein
MFEQVKDYKSACAVLGKKPIDKRRKLDEHVILYIMLSTITEAINFIANGNKPWIPEYKQSKLIKTWYSWWQIDWDKIKDGSNAGFFALYSDGGLGSAYADVDTHLRFISEDAAEYAAKTFQPLYMKHIFGID